MREEIRVQGVVFVAAVSCWLIALVLVEATRAGGSLELVVYALTAAFGLEFLWSSWPRLWRPGSSP
jgi:hypothetical protein